MNNQAFKLFEELAVLAEANMERALTHEEAMRFNQLELLLDEALEADD